MALVNLGNVVGLVRSETPPTKSYVIWGKILNPAAPEVVELRFYKGTGAVNLEANWPLITAGGKVIKVIPTGTTTYTLPAIDWAPVGTIPSVQLIDTARGTTLNIAPTYEGMVAPDYIPTSIKFKFGGGSPNDILLILS